MPSRVALDTPLLTLLVVGLTDEAYIAKHKRLASYTLDDYRIIFEHVGASGGIVATPNTLTETSNHLRQIRDPARGHISIVFGKVIAECAETYVESALVSGTNEFRRLGLTDAALLELAAAGNVLLTVDGALCATAQQLGLDAFYFIRSLDRAT